MEFENLLTLIQAVSDSSLTGFKYEADGLKLNIQKEKVQVAAGGAQVTIPTAEVVMPKIEPQVVEDAGEVKSGKLIKSPLVGTFYAAPAEDAEPFVSVGDSVKKGQIIAIVEAMKLMNDIESDFDGTITEILVENGEAVEYGQPLFRIA